MIKKIKIYSEFITLGQLLKMANFIDSGGFAKNFLENNEVFVNGVKETRRGRKIYPGYEVELLDTKMVIEQL